METTNQRDSRYVCILLRVVVYKGMVIRQAAAPSRLQHAVLGVQILMRRWRLHCMCTGNIRDNVSDPKPPDFDSMPDGHISVLPADIHQPGTWMMFWSSWESWRTSCNSPLPECHASKVPEPDTAVTGPVADYDNGGRWLNSVFRLDQSNLVGFFHAEVGALLCQAVASWPLLH